MSLIEDTCIDKSVLKSKCPVCGAKLYRYGFVSYGYECGMQIHGRGAIEIDCPHRPLVDARKRIAVLEAENAQLKQDAARWIYVCDCLRANEYFELEYLKSAPPMYYVYNMEGEELGKGTSLDSALVAADLLPKEATE